MDYLQAAQAENTAARLEEMITKRHEAGRSTAAQQASSSSVSTHARTHTQQASSSSVSTHARTHSRRRLAV